MVCLMGWGWSMSGPHRCRWVAASWSLDHSVVVWLVTGVGYWVGLCFFAVGLVGVVVGAVFALVALVFGLVVERLSLLGCWVLVIVGFAVRVLLGGRWVRGKGSGWSLGSR